MTKYKCKVDIELANGNSINGIMEIRRPVKDFYKIDSLNENTVTYPFSCISDGNSVEYNRADILKLNITSVTMCR